MAAGRLNKLILITIVDCTLRFVIRNIIIILYYLWTVETVNLLSNGKPIRHLYSVVFVLFK